MPNQGPGDELVDACEWPDATATTDDGDADQAARWGPMCIHVPPPDSRVPYAYQDYWEWGCMSVTALREWARRCPLLFRDAFGAAAYDDYTDPAYA
jgi:hypothetical protein